MLAIFRTLLRLYPSTHRDEFAEEMLEVLNKIRSDRQKESSFSRAISFSREFTGLLAGALREHFRTILVFFGPSIFRSRRLTMRSEFKFPKVTVALMAIILAAIILAMDKARAIQDSGPYSSPQVGPIRSADFSLFLPLLLALGAACLAGAIGWVILFALHRSGIHRLSDVDSSSGPRPAKKFTN